MQTHEGVIITAGMRRTMDRLKAYIELWASGYENVKTKAEVSAGTGVHWRTLNTACSHLCAEGFPIGTDDNGWWLMMKKSEMLDMERREHARAMSILANLRNRREAFYSYHRIDAPVGQIAQQNELTLPPCEFTPPQLPWMRG